MSDSVQHIHKLKVLHFDEASWNKKNIMRHNKLVGPLRQDRSNQITDGRPINSRWKCEPKNQSEMPCFRPYKNRLTKQQYTKTNIVMDTLRLFNKTNYKYTETNQEDKMKKRNENKEVEQTSNLYIENECDKSKKYRKHGEVEVLFSRDNVNQMDCVNKLSHDNKCGVKNSSKNIETSFYQQQSSNCSKLNEDRKKRSRNTITRQECACTAARTHHTASATQMSSTKCHKDHSRQKFKLITFSKNTSSSLICRRKSPSLSDVCKCVSSTIRSITNTAIQAALGPETLSYPCTCKSPALPNAIRPQQQSCEPCWNKVAVNYPEVIKPPESLCRCTAKKRIQHPVTQCTETEKHTQSSEPLDRKAKKQQEPWTSGKLNPPKHPCNGFAKHYKIPCFKPRVLRNAFVKSTNFKRSTERGYSEEPKGCNRKLKYFLGIKRKSNASGAKHFNERTSMAGPIAIRSQPNYEACLKNDKQKAKDTTLSNAPYSCAHKTTSTAGPIGVRAQLPNCEACLKNDKQKDTKLSNAPCSCAHKITSTAGPLGISPQLPNCEACLKNDKQKAKDTKLSNAPCSCAHKTTSTAGPLGIRPKLPKCEACLQNDKQKAKDTKLSNTPCANHFHKATLTAGPISVLQFPNCEACLKNGKRETKDTKQSNALFAKHLHQATCEPCLMKPTEKKRNIFISPKTCFPYCSRVQNKKQNDTSKINQLKPCDQASYSEHDELSNKKCMNHCVLNNLDTCTCHGTQFIRKSEDSNIPCKVHQHRPITNKSQTYRDAACGVAEKKTIASCIEHDISYEQSANNFDSCTCSADKLQRTAKGTSAPCAVHLHKPTSCHAMLDASCEVAERKTKATRTKHNNKICYEKCFKSCMEHIFTSKFKTKPKSSCVNVNTEQNLKTSQTSCNMKRDVSCEVLEKRTEATTYTDYVDACTAVTYTKSQATEPHEYKHEFSARACLKYFLFGIIVFIWSPFIIMVLLCWLLTYPFRPTCIANKKPTYRERLEDNYRNAERKYQRPFAKTFCKWVKGDRGQCYGINSILSLVQETHPRRTLRKLPDTNTTFEIQRMEYRERGIKPIDTEGQIKDRESQTAIVITNQPIPRCAHTKPYISAKRKSPCSVQENYSINDEDQGKCCMCGEKKSKSFPPGEIKNNPSCGDNESIVSPPVDTNNKSVPCNEGTISSSPFADSKRKCCACSDKRRRSDKKEKCFTSGDKTKMCKCNENKRKFPNHDNKKETSCCSENRTPSLCYNDKNNKCCLCGSKGNKKNSNDDKKDKTLFCGNENGKSSVTDDKSDVRVKCECGKYENKSLLCDEKNETSSPCGDKSKCCVCDKDKSVFPPHADKKDTCCDDKKTKCSVCTINRSKSPSRHDRNRKSSSCGDKKSKCCVCNKSKSKSPSHDNKKATCCDGKKIKCCKCSSTRSESLSPDDRNRKSSSCGDKKSKCCVCKKSKSSSHDNKNTTCCDGKKIRCCVCSSTRSKSLSLDDRNRKSSSCADKKSKCCVCNKSKSKSHDNIKATCCDGKKNKCCVCSGNRSESLSSDDRNRKSSPCIEKKSKCCVCNKSKSKSPQHNDKKEKKSPCDKFCRVCGKINEKCVCVKHKSIFTSCEDKKVASSPCGVKKRKCCECDRNKSKYSLRDDKKKNSKKLTASSPCGDKKIKCCVCGKLPCKFPLHHDKKRTCSPCSDKKIKNKCCPCGDHRCRSPDGKKFKNFPCGQKKCKVCCICGKREFCPCCNKKSNCYACGDHKRKSSPCCCDRRRKPIKKKNKSTCIKNQPKTGICCKSQPTCCQKSTPIIDCFKTLKNTVTDVEAQMIDPTPDCEDLYLQTIKRKPCFCLYKCCPDLYPYILTICDCYRSFFRVILYVLMSCVWLPTLFCFYCCWELLSCCFCK